MISEQGSPWGEGKPFCFTKAGPTIEQTRWEWEECDIPVCGTDCIRDGIDPLDPDLPICDPVRFVQKIQPRDIIKVDPHINHSNRSSTILAKKKFCPP